MADDPPASERAITTARREAGRAFVASLAGRPAGDVVRLDDEAAHHLTRVRRLVAGAHIELLDDAGRCAAATLEGADGTGGWRARLQEVPREAFGGQLTVYAALPKGSRADWLVEKLGEIGVARLVPLRTARSVVDPRAAKLERFERLARESAKQSRRAGVLRVEPVTELAAAVAGLPDPASAVVLATERAGGSLLGCKATAVFVGPEGGWTDTELAAFADAGVAFARLTESVLRVETAAALAAGVMQMQFTSRHAAAEPMQGRG